ncbi:hypothetical protein [Pectobacterium polaris]|uniref:hypothetical protein n=1 Tax=Pectobacterium polaris TaxID=2042057 RepID=UPI003B985BF3
MVGWAGAPQGAPVSDEAGKTNSVQSTTCKIGLFGGGDIPTHRRLPYGYDHNPHSPVTYRFFPRHNRFHHAGRPLRTTR